MTPSYRYVAVVRRIVDGDTVDLDVDMGFRAWRIKERFRLTGVNAPEMKGPERAAGQAAKTWVEAMLPIGAIVTIESEKDPDNFGRWIARLWIDGTCVNDALVAAGHAKLKNYT